MIYHRIGDAAKDYVSDKHCLILQICNCISCKIHKNSFGANLYETLPYSSPYPERKCSPPYQNLAEFKYRNIPGTITFRFPPQENTSRPVVCCLFAQYDMGDGTKRYYAHGKFVDEQHLSMLDRDTKNDRLGYFQECLKRLNAELVNNHQLTKDRREINKIVIPKLIGCGLGGGNWKEYYSAIVDFSNNISKNIDVVIVEKKHFAQSTNNNNNF